MHSHFQAGGNVRGHSGQQRSIGVLRWIRSGGRNRFSCGTIQSGVEKWAVRKYMGTEEKHTVYESELVGLSLAAELLKQEQQV